MIRVDRLRKEYGTVAAVKEISFEVQAGRIFGLLGPNGAGKTTTISCLCGLVVPTSGRIEIAGHELRTDGRAARAAVGVVPQELALYLEISAIENLRYWGGVQGVSGSALRDRIPRLLERVGLSDRAREPIKRFSGGMLRRLNLACGLIHEPQVLLLDEPTVGIDPQSRVHVLDLIKERARAGVAVLYTTHYMSEAETLCDEFAILDHGAIIARGSLDQLLAEAGEAIRREPKPEPSLERLFLHLTGRDLRE